MISFLAANRSPPRVTNYPSWQDWDSWRSATVLAWGWVGAICADIGIVVLDTFKIPRWLALHSISGSRLLNHENGLL